MSRKLTPKQERFAQIYVELGNASEAYRRVYSCGGMSQHAIEVEASRLLNHPVVSLRIAELTEKAGKKTEVTRERIINRLAEFAWPEDDGVVSDRDSIKALELLGKRFALWIEKHEHDGPAWREIFERLPASVQAQIVEALDQIEVEGEDGHATRH